MPIVRFSDSSFAFIVASLLVACGGDANDSGSGHQGVSDGGGATGGSTSSGGASVAGAANGGSAAGGAENGGSSAGGSSAGGAANGGSAGAGAAGACTDVLSTPKGRSASASCQQTKLPSPPSDAGPTTCATDADCGSYPLPRCLHGTCGLDACLTDGDCATGTACVCASDYYGGNGVHGNSCFTAQCRVDADCGPGGACAVSFSGYCGAPTGLFCHSSADACHTDADCCGTTPACRYQPILGHWACQSATVCAG